MPIAEIGLGLTLAGVLLDIKDAITAIDAFIDAPSASNFGGVIFAGVAFVPGVGDAAKAGWKGARLGDDVIDAGADVSKRLDNTVTDALPSESLVTGATDAERLIPAWELVPVGRGKVAPKEGDYRGITPKDRREARATYLRQGGPPKIKTDVDHRTPLSQVPPGEKVNLKPQQSGPNRAGGRRISGQNAARRGAGLFVRKKPYKKP